MPKRFVPRVLSGLVAVAAIAWLGVALVGHANLTGLFGTTEFQLQETPLP